MEDMILYCIQDVPHCETCEYFDKCCGFDYRNFDEEGKAE